jgi:hypothetical protein
MLISLKTYIAVALVLVTASGSLCQDFYPRMKEPGVFWYGANHVFVGQDQFIKYADRQHTPEWQHAGHAASNSVGYDFRDVTCSAATQRFTARGFELPNGTAIQFKRSATLPTPFRGWKDKPTLWYYVVNAGPATTFNSNGSFQLAATPGGTAIPITDTAGTCSTVQQMSFAGWKGVITFDVPQTYRVNLNLTTHEFQTVNNAGTPVNHGFPTTGAGNGAYFTTDGTLPVGIRTLYGGDRAKYCVLPTSDPTKFRTRRHSQAQGCDGLYFPPNDTFTATCGTPGDNNASCTMDAGYTLPGLYYRLQTVNVLSGTKPAQYIRLDGTTADWNFNSTVLKIQESSVANSFRLTEDAGATRITWNPSGGQFKVTFRVLTDTFTDTGTGRLYVSKANSPVMIKSMAGWPAGTQFAWRQGTELAVIDGVGASSLTTSADPNNAFRYGRMISQSNEGNATAYRVTVIFKVPAITAPGMHSITVKFDQSNGNTTSADVNAKTFTFPLYATTLVPASGPSLTPADFTPVPGIASWEDLMTSTEDGGAQGGSSFDARRCPGSRYSIAQVAVDLGDPGFSSQEQRVWYYDGDRSFQKIADYLRFVKNTPDDTWKNCSEYIANDMANDYATGVTPPGYRYRLRGIYIMSGQGTLDKNKYSDIVRYQGVKGFNSRGENYDFNMRETALSFERRLQAAIKTGTQDHALEVQADVLIGWVWMWGNREQYPSRAFMQPFMMGMVQRALWWYYAAYHADPRIPVATKAYADAAWAWYNPTTKRVLYNPEPVGPRCDNRCQEPIESTENNFVAPSFWAVWRTYGDNTYRDRGDELFSNATHDRRPSTGKEWGQFFYFAWDGMCWRTGRCSVTTPQY